jgi:DNA-binding winged helix-turn-helix (wHTH) protein/TolB-like protein/Tfp pilus assembly protein PilF
MTRQVRHFYDFGQFRLEPVEQRLLRGGEVVPLTPKAFELLVVLVESGGSLLSKEELMSRLWRDAAVEEANLSHHIYKLREVLGDGKGGREYIETLPRRGYRFVAPVTEIRDEGIDLLLEEHARTSIVVEESEVPDQFPTGERDALPIHAIASLTTGSPSHSGKGSRTRAVLIACALALCVLAAAGYAVWRARAARDTNVNGTIRSLAVLPFKPLSNESRDEALELGMADALITRLSNVHQLVVRPTSSIIKYANPDSDLLAAGREQNVDAVIDGKVQRVGDRIRLTVQMLRVSDGATLWGETFDDQFTNVFAVQDSISERAARALVSRLSGDEEQRVAKHYTNNIEAYQLYLEGRYHWAKFSPEGVAKSIDYFNHAIAIDPDYALAYTGLANAYSVQGAFGSVSPAETLPKAKRAVETALRLDDSLADAHSSRGGLALLYERDWATARREFEKAIELDPNLTDPHQLLGYYWETMEQFDKAGAELRKAQQVAPLMSVVNMDLGDLAYYLRRYDEAIELYGRAHDLDPDFVPLPFYLAQAYERKGEYDQAIASCQRTLASTPDDPALLSLLGYAYARAGKKKEAQGVRAKLEEMQRRRYVSPFMLALLYTGLGDKDKAIEQLNKAYEVHDPQLTWVNIDPQLDDLHSDPRYVDLLRRMNLVH